MKKIKTLFYVFTLLVVIAVGIAGVCGLWYVAEKTATVAEEDIEEAKEKIATGNYKVYFDGEDVTDRIEHMDLNQYSYTVSDEKQEIYVTYKQPKTKQETNWRIPFLFDNTEESP